jgi:hypothetical protein
MPDDGFTDFDTLAYRLSSCGDDTSFAYICIYVAETPDNIEEANCYLLPPESEWRFKKLGRSAMQVNTYGLPFTGNVDDDGWKS